MNDALSISSVATLNSGMTMPLLGLGVYQISSGQPTVQAVLWALEAGYRHIDTASFYGNEADVGVAIRTSGIPRSEIFVTTKLWPTDYFRAEAACRDSLSKLGLDYLDLYLLHWPSPIGKKQAWLALEKLYRTGTCRAIGVSNFTTAQIDALGKSSAVVPAVNQVEFSPFRFQKTLLDDCRSRGIQLEAYSPLTRGKRLLDPRITAIAESHGKSNAQVLIRWSLQRGLVVIPKSASQKRIVENANVFDFALSDADMANLDALHENYHALFK